MESGFRSPLIDFFRRGEVARDVRLMAAEGALAPRAHEQLALLILLSDDADESIAASANATLDALPVEPLQAFLARSDVPDRCATSSRREASAPAISRPPTPGRSSMPIADPEPAEDETDEKANRWSCRRCRSWNG